MNFEPSESSELFKVLGVENRVRMIELLKENGPMGVKDISSRLEITPAAVSQHLKILKQAGLVRPERKGYFIPYSINEKALENCGNLLGQVCTCGCEGSGNINEAKLKRADLEALKQYENELEKELQVVKDRIEEMNRPKK